jgi:hypothetical protein
MTFGWAHAPAGLARARHPASLIARRPRHPAAGVACDPAYNTGK